MSQVYEHLAWQMQSDPDAAHTICTAFQSQALIWLPDKACDNTTAPNILANADDDRQSNRKKVLPGTFYGTADKVFFKDHTRVIEESSATPARVLVKYYFTDDLHSFFLEQLRYIGPVGGAGSGVPGGTWGGQQTHAVGFQPIVPVYPTTADYCDLLACLALHTGTDTHSTSLALHTTVDTHGPKQASDTDNKNKQQAVTVLLHWSGLIANGIMPYPDVEFLQQALHTRALLPTTDREWLTASDGLYILDDADLAKAFKDKPVHFLWLPENMQPSTNRYGPVFPDPQQVTITCDTACTQFNMKAVPVVLK